MTAKSATSLRGLRTFCAAAHHESFSAAAEELFITPSAISHQIKSLEEELDTRLFDRSARDMSLTAEGRALYRKIRPLIEQLDAIVGTYKNDRARGSVRLSVQPFFASEYFMPRLGEFTELHPEIDIQVGASDERADSGQIDADLSIRLYREPPSGLESVLLTPLRLAVAGSAAMAEKLRVKKSRIEGSLALIVHESMPDAWAQWSEAAGIRLPENPKVTRLDSMIAVVRGVEQGLGAALVPVPMANQWFQQGTITKLFADELESDMGYFLSVRPASARKAGVETLRRWILERFSIAESR